MARMMRESPVLVTRLATSPPAPTFAIMQARPVVNVEEFIAKTVGRRVPPRDPLRISDSNKANAIAWKKAFPYRGAPRGVYRFNTHEEADAWMMMHTGPRKP
jgi:hypothetical protein